MQTLNTILTLTQFNSNLTIPIVRSSNR